jgi:hypothetical protein
MDSEVQLGPVHRSLGHFKFLGVKGESDERIRGRARKFFDVSPA